MDICVPDSDWLKNITKSRKKKCVHKWWNTFDMHWNHHHYQWQNNKQYDFPEIDESKLKQNQKERLKNKQTGQTKLFTLFFTRSRMS